ncbi:17061_t:CDS:2 [Funneliformis geosporum]|uniref:3216_t:CDS:1 n=1 Tax=Funneliformis geosporum TaxID=1117311 RepID=A0A9W4SSH5_9GLOM|nr:17061_t:CDS:2 [Funneliformis geosporum]CAI2179622.1 3216_t:CDS:2 [Funneliformis geosporum]
MGKVNSKSHSLNAFKSKKKHCQQLSTHSISSSSTISSFSSESTSQETIASSNEDLFHYIGDRKFCKFSEKLNYVYPVDADESDRGQTSHFMYKHVWDGNFSAPVEQMLQDESTKVLDIGCGSGTWILDMAFEYKNAHFTGIDVAELYPVEIKPKNVSFVQANVLEGLPFEDNTFDFVYMRFMMFAFTLKNWDIAIKELARVCKPGGFIELMEKDIFWYNEGPFCKSARTVMADELREQKNIEVVITPILNKILSQYSDVERDAKIMPFGEWGGKLGNLYRELYSWGAKNLKKVMTDVGFSEDEWDETVEICLKQLQERKSYDKIHRFWIKKC